MAGLKTNKRQERVNEEIDFTSKKVMRDNSTKLTLIDKKLKNFKNPYVGNKRKLIPFLITTIDNHNIKYDTVLDLFSGSGFVSMAFKMLDKCVFSNDLLTCSYFNTVAFVENNIALTHKEKTSLFKLSPSREKIINDKYRNRLSDYEISIIGNYYNRVVDLFGDPLELNPKAVLAVVYMQNYIIERCFVGGRLNSGQILAKYDHRIKHDRNKGCQMFHNGRAFSRNDMRWTKPIYPKDKLIHRGENMDALALLKIAPKADLCYIDPPYGGSQSDYGFMYGFFEELIHRMPYSEIEKKREGASKFISKNNYKENFNELIEATSGIPNIVVSYNDTSWGTIDEICEVIKKYRKHVVVEEFSYAYKYRSKENNDTQTKEYVIVAKE